MKLNKVCTNLNQDFTEQEMTTARNNIGAASSDNITTINDNITTINGALANLTNRVNGLEQKEAWKEVDIDMTKTNSEDKNEVAYFGNDGYIGYYFDNGGNLRLTWYNDSAATFKMWSNEGYTDINVAGPVAISAQFYNGNGQHNTLRWKLNSFRCVDFHFNPDTKKLYWKEL